MIAVAMQVARGAEVVEEAVVRGRREPTTPGASRIESRDARDLPGTQGDPSRVVESMAGVGRSSPSAAGVILWGAAPARSTVLLDGVPIPRLYHGGGVRSTVQGFFLEDLTLLPGGFGAEYGRATGGVISLESAAIPARGAHAVASVDLLDAAFSASRAIDARWRVAVGARMGYAADVVRAVAPEAARSGVVDLPRYVDWQARVDHRADARTALSLLAVGSRDLSQLDLLTQDATRQRALNRESGFARVIGSWTREHPGGARTALRVWGGRDLDARDESFGPLGTSARSAVVRAGLRARHAMSLAPGLSLRAGLDAEGQWSDVTRRGSLTRPPREGDVYALGQSPPDDLREERWLARRASVGVWCEAAWTLARGAVTITPGIRLDADLLDASASRPPAGDLLPRGLARLALTPQPRLAVSARAARWLTLRASGGRYHAPPAAEDLSAVFGNAALEATTAWHAVVGARVELPARVELSADAFYHAELGAPARATTGAGGVALTNDGGSEAWGAQVTLRASRSPRWTAWLTYTVLRATVTDAPGAAPRRADTDQTHLLTAVGSVSLGRGFRAGLRARFATGAPRSAVVGRALDAVSGETLPVFGVANGERLPPFFSLDLRVDKSFAVWRGRVTVFLDVLNALNRENAEDVVYDPTFNVRRYVTGLPLLADLGVRGEL